MHDHLLGCHQFQAVEDDTSTHRYISLRHKYPLGMPQRVERDMERVEKLMFGDSEEILKLRGFEEMDHTPAHMQADFPHEYDLHTMYGDAAKRAYAGLKVRDEAVLVSQSVSDYWMKGEFDRLCGVPKVKVKVMSCDYGRGDDLAAVIVEIVARILADKQRLRPGKKPLALDL